MELTRATFQVCQEGNTLGTTEEYETLDIECETQAADEGKFEPFLVIKTSGWSINDGEEFKKLVDRFIEKMNTFAQEVKSEQ